MIGAKVGDIVRCVDVFRRESEGSPKIGCTYMVHGCKTTFEGDEVIQITHSGRWYYTTHFEPVSTPGGWHDARELTPRDGQFVVTTAVSSGDTAAGWYGKVGGAIGDRNNKMLRTWGQVDRWRRVPEPPEPRDEELLLAAEVFGGEWKYSGNAIVDAERNLHMTIGEDIVVMNVRYEGDDEQSRLSAQVKLPCRAALRRTMKRIKMVVEDTANKLQKEQQ